MTHSQSGSAPGLDLSQLSRTISHALRHAPWLYELEPDDQGWVPVDALLRALRAHRVRWASVSQDDLQRMMAQSDKQRYQLRDERIRALYGHSLPGRISREAADPPPVLYHGTNNRSLPVILKEGLKPMGRQFVHLSADVPTALQVGRRKGGSTRILSVDADGASAAGVPFYCGNQQVWLANEVPARFLTVVPGK